MTPISQQYKINKMEGVTHATKYLEATSLRENHKLLKASYVPWERTWLSIIIKEAMKAPQFLS